MTVVRLAALLWRRGGARQRATLALTAAGVLVSTVLALLVVSVLPALGHRADRTAWRTPFAARDVADAPALQRTSDDSYRDQVIQRVDLAPTASGAPEGDTGLPAPPGLPRFPQAGEVFASPALAELMRSEPASELADRFPGTLVGTIGGDGLAHADELVVVVGREAGALADPSDQSGADAGETVGLGVTAPITGFATRSEQVADTIDPARANDADAYRTLAQMAGVLLVVPTLLLVGAAARLTAAQRAQRLAALRLAGATPGTVIALTSLEIAAAALAGVLAGIAVYLAVLPLAARIPLAGGPFTADDLRLSASTLAGVVAVVPLLAVGAAVVALRGVVGGPLQAMRRSEPRRPRAIRLLVLPVAWAFFVFSASSMRDGGSSNAVLIGLGTVIATLAVVGPWLTWLIGVVLRWVARGPSTLIAGRRIADDPKAAYRTVSGMVLAGLIAGFLFGVLPTIDAVAIPENRETALYLTVPVDQLDAVQARLDERFPEAALWWDGDGDTNGLHPALPEGSTEAFGTLIVDGTDEVEAARTAVLAVAPDAEVSSPYDYGAERILLADLSRASTVMSLASLFMATAAAGIGGAAAILDQRLTLARLRLVGTPITVLQRARRWQTLVPLVLASIGAMAFGAVAGLVMLGAFGVADSRIQPPDVTSMAVLGAAAVCAGLAVVAATRPLLVAVSRSTPRD